MKITLEPTYSYCQQGLRQYQQDARYPDADTTDGTGRFYCVCDGVGGSKHGEMASGLFCTLMADYLAGVDLTKPFTVDDFRTAMAEVMDTFHARLMVEAPESATTMTMAVVHGGGILLAHVGDSRIYHTRHRTGVLYRSNDDSLVNVLVHTGNLTPQEAIDHPRSNIITRCLNAQEEDPDTPLMVTVLNVTDLQPRDEIFLCSDGCLHSVKNRSLAGMLVGGLSLEDQCESLATESRESTDNNTAVFLRVRSVEPEKGDVVNPVDEVQVVTPGRVAPRRRRLFSRK